MIENGPERWARLDELYHAALEQPEEQRDAFLRAACGGDQELQREVSSLLRFHRDKGFLDKTPAEIAGRLEAAIRDSTPGGPQAGQIISHYKVIEKLGAGGMGVVYKAEDVHLDRTVALKFLSPDTIEDPVGKERLIREAKAAAALDHPNVCTVYEIGETVEGVFLAMALVDGESLSDRIARRPLKLEEALDIAIQTAQGLQSAHEKGIVHRDIKSSNLMINRQGQVKIMDFGIAQLANQARLTQSMTILGTPGYLAPEQAKGEKADSRSDIWSLGLVLYEMVTGRLPFKSDQRDALLHSIIHEEHEPVTALRAGLPVELDRILGKALAKDPSERYQHVDDLIVDLRRLAKQPAAGRVTASGKTGSRVTPARRLALWIGGFGVLSLIAFALAFWGRSQPVVPMWTGTRLGGPHTAWAPRISPDGKTLAFLALVDGTSQVAVMTPDSGSWVVLTKDRTRGFVSTLDWSDDGTHIYYTRFDNRLRGIFSVPAIGGEERLVLEEAGAAQPLPDGSMLVARNGDLGAQLYRYWPRDGRLQAFPVFLAWGDQLPLRVLPGGSRAVFFGFPATQPPTDAALRYPLYTMEISTGQLTKIPWDAQVESDNYWPLAVMPDGESVLASVPNGDLNRIVAISLRPPYQTRPVLDLQQQVQGIDIGSDGSLYVDQMIRPVEVLRFSDSGRNVEHIGGFPNITMTLLIPAVHLPDGRTLGTGMISGRRRLLVTAPGKEAVPFIQTDEETGWPTVLLGNDRLAFVIGSGEERRFAIADVENGRILGSIPGIKAGTIYSVASPDGETLYFGDGSKIWSVPVAGGTPRAITDGASVAAFPDGKHLVVMTIEPDGRTFKKVSVATGETQPLVPRDPVRFSPLAWLGARPIARDGRMLVLLLVSDSWFWKPGIFDTRNGTVREIPIDYPGDLFLPSWTEDGRIVVAAYAFQSSLWRYKPAK
jgi:hypothetical protein